MRIAVIGSGYVGLVSAACFAEIGHDVISVDNDAAKIDALRALPWPNAISQPNASPKRA